MRLVAVLISLGLLTTSLGEASTPGPATHTSQAVTLYDPDPAHVWNRLYEALFVREGPTGIRYGTDSLDPLLWLNSKYLLTPPSHQRALRVLDEFLQTHAENLIPDPLKRAILQRDLWAVFDWSVQREPEHLGEPQYEGEKRELQVRLAAVLRRLALTSKQIEASRTTMRKRSRRATSAKPMTRRIGIVRSCRRTYSSQTGLGLKSKMQVILSLWRRNMYMHFPAAPDSWYLCVFRRAAKRLWITSELYGIFPSRGWCEPTSPSKLKSIPTCLRFLRVPKLPWCGR